MVAADGFDGGGAPGADGSGDDGDDVEEIEGAALEVLRGDVFEGLPAGPEVHAVADLGVAGDGADAGVGEVADEAADGVVGDDAVGIDADVDLFVGLLEGEVEGFGLAAVGLGEDGDAALLDFACVGLGGDLVGVIA